MFCSQCQETAQNTGCVVRGVCGKSPEVANYQDLLIYVMKGLAKVNQCLRSCGKGSDQVDLFIMNGLFMTITNANFDKKRFSQEIKAGLALRDALKKEAVNCKTSCDFLSHDAMTWTASTEEEMEAKAKSVGILSTPDEDIRALRQLLVLGIKGMAAYTEHAYNLKHVDKDIFDFMQMALASTLSPNQSKDELLEEEFAKFVADYKPEEAAAIPAIRNFFKAYITQDTVRNIIDNREYTDLATHPAFTTKDFKAVPARYRALVPEYVRDYVTLNQFA